MTTTLHRRICPDTRLLLRYAVVSQLVVLSLIVIWRSLINPYDTSGSINPPCLSSSHPPPAAVLLPDVGSSIEHSIVWDGVFFTRIAECGYEYEQTYAFLPLLPLCLTLLSKTVFAPLVPVIGYRAVLGLSGYVVSNIAFVFASLYLYRLSVIVLKDKEVALRAYTESLYAFLSFGGLYYFMNGTNWRATFWLALSGFARSNGVINAGYICFRSMQQVNEAFVSRKGSCASSHQLLGLFIFTILFSLNVLFSVRLIPATNGRSVGEMRPWCRARLPLLYNYVQSHYWGVGFLRYFQVKQLPNFLLASPILSLATFSIVYYVKLWPKVFLSLGLQVASVEDELSASPLSRISEIEDAPSLLQDDRARGLRKRERSIKREDLIVQPSKSYIPGSPKYDPVVLLPFVLHLSFMVAMAIFVMHVQVATRFLSSSPLLYWFASHVMGSPTAGKRWGHCVWAYCAAYIFIGTLLFSNFYPFT